MDGKANLGKESAAKLSAAIGFTQTEKDYFEALVVFNQAKTPVKKDTALKLLRALGKEFGIKVLDADQYEYYAHWYHSALREVAASVGLCADPAALGDLLEPPIGRRETKKALAVLESAGLLTREKDGSHIQSKKLISTGSEVESLAIRNLHTQMAQRAHDAVDSIPKDERDISGVTIGVSAETFTAIKAELEETRRRIMTLVAQDQNRVERVYRLNLQLFPLSKPLIRQEGSSS